LDRTRRGGLLVLAIAVSLLSKDTWILWAYLVASPGAMFGFLFFYTKDSGSDTPTVYLIAGTLWLIFAPSVVDYFVIGLPSKNEVMLICDGPELVRKDPGFVYYRDLPKGLTAPYRERAYEKGVNFYDLNSENHKKIRGKINVNSVTVSYTPTCSVLPRKADMAVEKIAQRIKDEVESGAVYDPRELKERVEQDFRAETGLPDSVKTKVTFFQDGVPP